MTTPGLRAHSNARRRTRHSAPELDGVSGALVGRSMRQRSCDCLLHGLHAGGLMRPVCTHRVAALHTALFSRLRGRWPSPSTDLPHVERRLQAGSSSLPLDGASA